MEDQPDNSIEPPGGINVEVHQGWLRAIVATRVGEAEGVEEVLQNTAIAVLAAHERGIAIQHDAPWLYRVVVRQCLLYRRAKGRYRKLKHRLASRTEASIERNETMQRDALDMLLRDEARQQVRQALRELPTRDAEILVLKYCEAWSYQEISDHLGVRLTTVESRLHRARQRLRDRLRAHSQHGSEVT